MWEPWPTPSLSPGTNTVTLYGQVQVANSGPNVISRNCVGAGGEFNFTAQQTSSPTLTVPTGDGPFGNLTNFTYGSTGSVTLAAEQHALARRPAAICPREPNSAGPSCWRPCWRPTRERTAWATTAARRSTRACRWEAGRPSAACRSATAPVPYIQRHFNFTGLAGREFLGHDFRHRQQRFHVLPERAELTLTAATRRGTRSIPPTAAGASSSTAWQRDLPQPHRHWPSTPAARRRSTPAPAFSTP